MPELPAPSPLLHVADEHHGTTLVVRVKGEVDLCTGPELEQHLQHAFADVRPPEPLVVDLSGVAFIGSCGLTLLLRLHDTAESKGSSLHIVAGQRAVTRPIEVVGLNDTLRLYSTVEDALAHSR
ncbi:anti-anti-sigma factor [Prauserella sp. PE36]|uniref:Anti-sigma factor antagonist n=1 Tax=Prauserella endophytica TaxID=1592324 RepID=A0ABY2S6Q4_9PSEU|nr:MULTISPECIES: STAS domain-containing protein [Prauserella]RBM13839.1 anti-anti-sigma factor [Prauserella sp. PE36]TKG71554.1 STAS domain-containing protein [Prauserella endophytica]